VTPGPFFGTVKLLMRPEAPLLDTRAGKRWPTGCGGAARSELGAWLGTDVVEAVSSHALQSVMAYLDAYARWYRPADIAEVKRKVSLLNEPVHKEVIELRPGQAARSLHALLVGVRNQAQALLDRLETRGHLCAQGGAKRSGQSAVCCHPASGAGAGGVLGA